MSVIAHVIERVLNHISGAQGGLVGVYQRHDYRAERKAALLAWGARVAAIVEAKDKGSGPAEDAAPSNVVRIPMMPPCHSEIMPPSVPR